MDRWIPVMVRIEDYAEFCAEVEAREQERGEQSESIRSAPVKQAAAPVSMESAELWLATLKSWSVEDLRRIIETADRYKTMDRWMKAMDIVSQVPGPDGFRSTADIAAAAGMEPTKWRDAQRKITLHLKTHFPKGIETPLRGVWGPELGLDDNQFYWGLTVEQAGRWRQARADASR